MYWFGGWSFDQKVDGTRLTRTSTLSKILSKITSWVNGYENQTIGLVAK